VNLTGLHLLLTYRCTSECDHCFVYSSPRAEGTMSLNLAKNAVRQAANLGSVREIWIEGGEPFLYYPILREIVGFAHELGLETGIVTNAYYAETEEDARVWLTPLKEAGLTRLSVSDDSFHSEEFPQSLTVKHLLGAAEKLGIETGTICMQRPGEGGHLNAKGEPITGGAIRFRGRAIETLAKDQTAHKYWPTFNECPDEDWDEIGRLHLDAYGNLFSCQGIVLGNVNERPLAVIVEAYHPEDHPIISPLYRGGPAELVREFDLPLHEKYLDACHLCYTARRQLQARFPRELAPAQVYGIQ
jgi:hypothetical protein